jgi:alcohol dehydrogenase class IV
MRFNAEPEPQRFVPIARALGIDVTGMPATVAAEAAAEAVRDLCRRVGAPTRLRDIGVRAEEFRTYATDAVRDACISTNPRCVTPAEVVDLLRTAY